MVSDGEEMRGRAGGFTVFRTDDEGRSRFGATPVADAPRA